MPYSIMKRPKSNVAIQRLFDRISPQHPETLIASHFNVSAFAVRNWVTRGIPMKYWDRFAPWGISEEEVTAAHKIIRA